MRRLVLPLIVLWSAGLATADAAPLQVPLGEMVEGIACASDPTQTYTLYIPTSYTRNRRYPVLLIFDPRGRSLLAAELFRDAAEAYGWIIVSSDNTRSDGPMEPNILALKALLPEVHNRLPTDVNRIYAAGFSGGAIVATAFSKAIGEFAGIIACGGRFFPEHLEGNDVPIFATAGNLDFNFREMHLLDEFLAEQGNPHRLVIFDGTHSWMPSSVAFDAVVWLELIAMQRGLRATDAAMVRAQFGTDMAEAEGFADAGRMLEAARRYREIDQTYRGLIDPSAAHDRAAAIEASAEYRSQSKTMKKTLSFERRCNENINSGLVKLRESDVPPPVPQLARELGIDDLQHRAERADEMGQAAQRCLNGLYTGVAFYVPRDTAAQHRYAHAATAYEVALIIREENPVVWYNLACMRAQLGHGNAAMEALQHALDLGFDQTALLASDSDLDSLRDRDDFKALLSSVEK